MLRVVEHAAFSDTGRQRRANEDAFLSRSPLFAVADGMGGAKAGEIASRTAIDVIGHGVGDGVVRSRLAELVRRANRAVHEAQQDRPELSGMGTTATVAYIGEDTITIAHVGDSRAYLLRGGTLRRLTEDHSLVEEMRRQGRLTAEEAASHPQRSIITRALGPEPQVEVDVHEFALEPGDVVLLCSDGLTSMLPELRIGELLVGNRRLDIAGRSLVAAANAAGGRDNITVVLVRIGGIDEEEVEPDDQPTAIVEQVAVDSAPVEVEQPAARATPLQPRESRPVHRAHRRKRVLAAITAIVLTTTLIAVGGWAASRITYFIGGQQGYVAIYQGLPYDLPFGIKLYRPVYRSGVPLSSLDERRRGRLLDHQIRSGDDAQDLIKAVERDTLQ